MYIFKNPPCLISDVDFATLKNLNVIIEYLNK